jgi:hypothetical protein
VIIGQGQDLKAASTTNWGDWEEHRNVLGGHPVSGSRGFRRRSARELVGSIGAANWSDSTPLPGAVQVWPDVSCIADDLNGGTADLIWHEGYDHHLTIVTSAQGQVHSSTQVEMLALATAFDYIASHFPGCTVQVYSDSKSSLNYLPCSSPRPRTNLTKRTI